MSLSEWELDHQGMITDLERRHAEFLLNAKRAQRLDKYMAGLAVFFVLFSVVFGIWAILDRQYLQLVVHSVCVLLNARAVYRRFLKRGDS